MAKKSNSFDFIEKSKKIHNDNYDYSLVEYVNNSTKVKIICKKHGIFEQTPSNHLKKRRCPKCYGKFTKSTEQFISDSIEVHGNKYDYSLVKYINVSTKVRIKCENHIFEQTPNAHLNGQGCPKCLGYYKNNKDFIKDSIDVHGNKYDYSMVDYINATSKIKILCPVHGIFLQSPNLHISGKNGCPFCKQSKGEKEITNFLIYKNINFISQKRFDECKNKRKLPFDFYLPDYNMCIEYNGRQHYIENEYFGGKTSLEYYIINDNIKKDFCFENKIELFVINYNDDLKFKLNELKNKLIR